MAKSPNLWCSERDSNPYAGLSARDFKSRVSTGSTTRANIDYSFDSDKILEARYTSTQHPLTPVTNTTLSTLRSSIGVPSSLTVSPILGMIGKGHSTPSPDHPFSQWSDLRIHTGAGEGVRDDLGPRGVWFANCVRSGSEYLDTIISYFSMLGQLSDLNRKPPAYKAGALPIELSWQRAWPVEEESHLCDPNVSNPSGAHLERRNRTAIRAISNHPTKGSTRCDNNGGHPRVANSVIAPLADKGDCPFRGLPIGTSNQVKASHGSIASGTPGFRFISTPTLDKDLGAPSLFDCHLSIQRHPTPYSPTLSRP